LVDRPTPALPSPELIKKINARIDSLNERRVTEDHLKVLSVAYVIIQHFLGRPFFDRYVALSQTPDPYMLNALGDEDADERFVHQDRVARLADYLFRLQNEMGFDVLIERLTSNRDMRSVNLEAMIANLFKLRGFSVEILSLTSVRGQDFDFQIRRGSEIINVEVTGFTNDRFSVSNVKNVLHSKRNQLPDTHPAFLYCIVPPSWLENYKDLRFGTQLATYEFFARSKTKRINAVVYVTTEMKKHGNGVLFGEAHAPVYNPMPRFHVDPTILWPDRHAGARMAAWKELSRNPQMVFPSTLRASRIGTSSFRIHHRPFPKV
jgi:hypothetical protein